MARKDLKKLKYFDEKTCEPCNVGIVNEVNNLIEQGKSERAACDFVAGEINKRAGVELYTGAAIRNRRLRLVARGEPQEDEKGTEQQEVIEVEPGKIPENEPQDEPETGAEIEEPPPEDEPADEPVQEKPKKKRLTKKEKEAAAERVSSFGEYLSFMMRIITEEKEAGFIGNSRESIERSIESLTYTLDN